MSMYLCVVCRLLCEANSRMYVTAHGFTYTDNTTIENCESAIEHCEDIFNLMCGLGFLTDGRYEQDTNKICEAKLLLEAEYDRKLALKNNKELDECLI